MKTVPVPPPLRSLLHRLPRRWRSSLIRSAARCGYRTTERAPIDKAAAEHIVRGPVIVSGFFSDRRGVARSARLTVDALRRAGLEVLEDDVSDLLRNADPPPVPVSRGGVWILHCNPPEARAVLNERTALARAPLYRIGYWAWETPRAPADWLSAGALFHEVWAPSRFTLSAFEGVGTPLHRMPHPQPLAAKSLAFDSDVVRFTAFADLRSSAARKNPLGAIKAFRQAFPEPRGAELTVKLSAPDADAEAVAAIAAAEQGCTDIRVIAEHLDDRDLQRLFDQTDVLVSLHRSEGFGLTIAEAMAAGKAVVATAWSGNLDFMPDIGIQRVRAELVPIEDPSGLYSGQHWAEPDLAAAAAALRTLAIDAELRAHCGELNRAAIARLHLAWDRDVLLAQPIGRFGSFLV